MTDITINANDPAYRFLAEIHGGEVVPNIGQIDDAARKSLERLVKLGAVAEWRGKWFPQAGSPFGMGPDKTCYGLPEVAEYFTSMKAAFAK